MKTTQSTIDVLVSNQGSIFLFKPLTDAARSWIEENVSDESQWFGKSLVVEHRYAPQLARGMQEAGLQIR